MSGTRTSRTAGGGNRTERLAAVSGTARAKDAHMSARRTVVRAALAAMAVRVGGGCLAAPPEWEEIGSIGVVLVRWDASGCADGDVVAATTWDAAGAEVIDRFACADAGGVTAPRRFGRYDLQLDRGGAGAAPAARIALEIVVDHPVVAVDAPAWHAVGAEEARMQIRRSHERGHAEHGWLDSFHTFSFADYYDPAHMGYRALRVINEDRVAPRAGFPTHPHRDMEILTYVLEGELGHKDSMGNGSVIRPGEVQRMSAGTGVYHSEMNASRDQPVHLLQIWIQPDRTGYPPGYEQKAFPEDDRTGRLRLVASRDGRDGSVTIHQDAQLWTGRLRAGDRARHTLAPGRHAWIHVARGDVDVNGTRLAAGDAAAIDDAGPIDLVGADGEVLLFDLA